jgi:hypothetical protein
VSEYKPTLLPLPCPIDDEPAEAKEFVIEGMDGEDAGRGWRVEGRCGHIGPWGGLSGDAGKKAAVIRWNGKYVQITIERK